jgi:hypothetical protein
MFLKEHCAIFVFINIVTMGTNVTNSTINVRLKKKYQISLRRFMLGQSPSAQMREWVGLDYLGFKKWVSGKMLPGMNWNNYGEIWNIAHVVNLIHFDLSKEEDCRIAWNYRNLMPLFSEHSVLKENDLGFSEMLLGCLEPCPVVDKLKAIVENEMKLLYERYGMERINESSQWQKAM